MPNWTVDQILLGVTVYGGVVLAASWLAMVIWAYRDMRARTRDGWAQVLVALLVLVLNLPGLLIYLFLRPRETLAEAYERSLEEEALLQEIEEKPTCPGCAQRVQESWQVCPHCRTRLKKACVQCGALLHLSWSVCPHCVTAQAATEAALSTDNARRGHVRPATTQKAYAPPSPVYDDDGRAHSTERVEFVDGEEY